MQVEAIYDHGRLELPANFRLKHAVVNVLVIVPDDEVLADSPSGHDQTAASLARTPDQSPREVSAPGGAIRTAIDEILGPWKQQLHAGAALRDEDFDRLRYQALEEKSLGRQ
ncbi:MAG: hypothetical protein V5B30_03970 [Candidatus Accumulibacter delftensis]|jgi:hypothetical protein